MWGGASEGGAGDGEGEVMDEFVTLERATRCDGKRSEAEEEKEVKRND